MTSEWNVDVGMTTRKLRPAALLAITSAIALAGCYGPSAATAIVKTSPSPTRDAIAYSQDNMWAFLASTPDLYERYDSLGAAVEGSDVVLTGRYVGLERGGTFAVPGSAPSWHAIALIKPDVVLKGSPVLDNVGRVRIEFVLVVGGDSYPEAEFSNLLASLPTDPALLFLQSWETYFRRADGEVPAGFQALLSDEIYRTIGGDGAVRITDGVLVPPDYVEGWPRGLSGMGLEAAETEVISALERGQPSP